MKELFNITEYFKEKMEDVEVKDQVEVIEICDEEILC
jgi:hypothetical protein